MRLEPRCRHGNIRSAEPCRDCDERDALRARIDDLSRAYAVQGLALEEMAAERDRYRYALDRITCEPPAYGADMLMIARDALKTRE